MTTEPVPTRDEMSMSAFERAYAADVGESVETLTKRGLFRWHGRCYVSDSINTRYRGWMLSQAANAAEIARLQAQVDALAVALSSVRHALPDILPEGAGRRFAETGRWAGKYEMRGITGTVTYRADDMECVYSALDAAIAALAAVGR